MAEGHDNILDYPDVMDMEFDHPHDENMSDFSNSEFDTSADELNPPNTTPRTERLADERDDLVQTANHGVTDDTPNAGHQVQLEQDQQPEPPKLFNLDEAFGDKVPAELPTWMLQTEQPLQQLETTFIANLLGQEQVPDHQQHAQVNNDVPPVAITNQDNPVQPQADVVNDQSPQVHVIQVQPQYQQQHNLVIIQQQEQEQQQEEGQQHIRVIQIQHQQQQQQPPQVQVIQVRPQQQQQQEDQQPIQVIQIQQQQPQQEPPQVQVIQVQPQQHQDNFVNFHQQQQQQQPAYMNNQHVPVIQIQPQNQDNVQPMLPQPVEGNNQQVVMAFNLPDVNADMNAQGDIHVNAFNDVNAANTANAINAVNAPLPAPAPIAANAARPLPPAPRRRRAPRAPPKKRGRKCAGPGDYDKHQHGNNPVDFKPNPLAVPGQERISCPLCLAYGRDYYK